MEILTKHRMIVVTVSVALVVLSGGCESAFGQKITTYESLPGSISARTMGFADATVADIYDVSSMYTNAASLAFIQNSAILLSHSEEQSIHAITENISAPISIGPHRTISFGISAQHVGYVGESRQNEFKVFEYGYNFGIGVEVVHALSVGGGLDVRYGKSDVSDLWAVSGTVGILYTPLPDVSYGAVFKGIGNGIIYSSDQVSTSLSSSKLLESVDAGLTLRYPTIFHPVGVIISLSNEKVFVRDGVIYRGGVEILLWDILLLRGGYNFDWGSETGSARYGVGIRFNRVSGDFAYTPHEWADQFYRLSLAIALQ